VEESRIDDSNLIAAPIELLFVGMDVKEDIYNSDGTRLLLKRGATLGADSLESLRNLNGGRETIYVTGNTYKAMLDNRRPIKADSRKEIEKTSGYAAIKDDTFELLDEIARTKVVQQEALVTVSTELSSRLEVNSPSLILSLINALAPVDEYLQRHCVNVSLLNGLQGRWLGLPKKEVDRLVLVGLLHDCGKALIPPQVLNAPRKLTGVEFEVIKMHTVYSYELLTDFPEAVRRAARCHHEKITGGGYPDRLPREKISLDARITAVSDIYDAMVSQRAYKKPRSPFSIMAMLVELKDSDLDARLVDVFVKHMPQELINKPVVMSNGTVGAIRSIDPDDIEYHVVEINGNVIKSGKQLFCTSMYNEE